MWLRGPAAILYLSLFAAFFAIGLVLVALGFDLNEVDRWLDAQGGWLDLAGRIIFKILLFFVLLICAFIIGSGLYDRVRRQVNEESFGWGWMVGALFVGYFAWVGVFAPL